MMMILSVAAGGALGAVLRYSFNLMTIALLGHSFPWGTLLVNALGSFLMGVLVTIFALSWTPSVETRAFLTIGLLGAFTTFSTFSLDAVTLWEQGNSVQALGYTIGSVVLSIVGLVAGIMIVKAAIS